MNRTVVKLRAERVLARLGYASGVLMYHRIATEEYDPWGLCVTEQHFAEHLAVLKERVECVPLEQLVDRRWFRAGAKLRLAVTFDDGYVDNVRAALPLLERFDVPATIFVVSSKLGSPREFWWDTLERCILRPVTLPDQLELLVAGVKHAWKLAADDASALKSWRADTEEATTPRQVLFLALWELLAPHTAAEQDRCLDRLMEWAGVASDAVQSRLPMSIEDLAALRAHPLIEIGGHTLAHRSLPGLSPGEQQAEFSGGQAALSGILGRQVKTFSYPYGRYSPVTLQTVSKLSSLACTSRHAPVTAITKRWEVPRLQVTDSSGIDFVARLGNHLPQLAK